jgi:hypothetical protein
MQQLLLDLSIEYFPFQPCIIAVLIPARKKSHRNFKTSSLTSAATKKASLSILAEGFFNEFVGVESKFISRSEPITTSISSSLS